MRFEKWQALGNDYLIVERAELPFELTPERVQRLCHPHFGPGADGVLELSPPDKPGFVARLRIFKSWLMASRREPYLIAEATGVGAEGHEVVGLAHDSIAGGDLALEHVKQK